MADMKTHLHQLTIAAAALQEESFGASRSHHLLASISKDESRLFSQLLRVQRVRLSGDVNPIRNVTASKKSKLTPHETYLAILRTVRTMRHNKIDLPIFLEGLSWGNEECINDGDIKNERTSLLHGEELPCILRTWHTPPRTGAGTKRLAGAKSVMEVFAIETTTVGLMKLKAPVWDSLSRCLTTATPTQKDREKVILTIISVLCYRLSHHFNLLPKILAAYMKFCGLSAQGFDILHALGLIMSRKWACDVVDRARQQQMNGALDSIMAMNKYALQAIKGVERRRSSASLALTVWRSTWDVDDVVRATFLDTMTLLGEQLKRIILEDTSLFADREELLSYLWTKLGGNIVTANRPAAPYQLPTPSNAPLSASSSSLQPPSSFLGLQSISPDRY
ncbi:hypothetical protein FA13DRAFT_1798708 [Coprinellus micaceus]|uniref:Uncharacterized protein n=1 Tax=Coprinellus micaceus TaxID=71717 RepID=A0A4Y7SL60_COPMI|nr:hypothetical protein FA13DRAFT_1798708 [Coprinellus micaceus]